MPTADRTRKRLAKQLDRIAYNTGRKIIKAAQREAALAKLGKTVIVTEKDGAKTYVLPPTPRIVEPPTPNRLSWLGGKQYAQQGDSRKSRSGFKPENLEACIEDSSRTLAKEIAKALMPPVEPATVPAPEVGEVTQ